MNEKNGKLLSLAGFGISLILEILAFVFALMSKSLPSFLNILGILCMPLIAVGFVMVYLDRKNMQDAVIAGCFCVCALVRFINIPILGALSGLILLVGYGLWAFKLMGNNRKAAMAIIGAFVFTFVGVILGVVLGAASGSLELLVILVSLVGVAGDALLAFAAYLDYNG